MEAGARSVGEDLPASFDRPQIVLRTTAAYCTVARLVLGILLRTRILLLAPLKPEAPLIWLIAGLLQGITVSAAICLLVIAVSRKSRRTETARALLVIAFIINGLLYILTAEAITYLGRGLHPESFDLALHEQLLLGSMQGGALRRITVLLTAYVIALIALERFARRSKSTRVTLPRLALLLVPGLVSAASAPYIDMSETTASPVFQLLQIMSERRRFQQLHGVIQVPQPALPPQAARLLMPPLHHDFLDDRFPLAYRPPRRSPDSIALRPAAHVNVIFILMESMRAAEVGVYGGPVPNVTPNFDRLAKNGILIDDAYSVGGFTPEGELGIWYGLLASPYEIVIRNRPDAQITGLPEFLRPRGYHFLWSHPGDQTLYLSSRFYDHRGFIVSDGQSFSALEPRTNWGYSDKALVRRTLSLIDSLEEPFAGMELTISNHHPFELPSDAEPFALQLPAAAEDAREEQVIGHRIIPMLRTMHYSDEALGLFFQKARSRPWFNRTIFVIVGDHGTPTKPLHDIRSVHELMEFRHHVAMLFYSPLLPGGIRIPGPASQADILPTLLNLLRIPGPRAGVGVDLFDPVDRAQDRPVVSWNPEARTVTINTRRFSYHGVVANIGEAPIEFGSETLIDRIRDPIGLDNIAEERAAETARFRQIARVFVEVYPSLIATGKSGLPGVMPR